MSGSLPPGSQWLRQQTAELGGSPELSARGFYTPRGWLRVPLIPRFDTPLYPQDPVLKEPKDLTPNYQTSFPERERRQSEDERRRAEQKAQLESQRQRVRDLEKAQDEAMDRWNKAAHSGDEAGRIKAHEEFMRIQDDLMPAMRAHSDLIKGWLDRPEYTLPTATDRFMQVQTDVNAIQQGIDQPKLGKQRGQLHLLPQYQQLGPIRPFGPGEWLHNPNGSWSSEQTRTVPYDNGYAVVPGLWIVNGEPHLVDEGQAAEYARQSKLNWPTFPDSKTAEEFAGAREKKWQTVPIGRSDMQQPLWSRAWPPPQ